MNWVGRKKKKWPPPSERNSVPSNRAPYTNNAVLTRGKKGCLAAEIAQMISSMSLSKDTDLSRGDLVYTIVKCSESN